MNKTTAAAEKPRQNTHQEYNLAEQNYNSQNYITPIHHPVTLGLQNITHIKNLPDRHTAHNAAMTTSQDSVKNKAANAAQSLVADKLFILRDELNRHPECLRTSYGYKEIDVDYDQRRYSLTCTKILLPSGHYIYVTYLGGNRVIFYQGIYHLENSVPALAGHLAGVTQTMLGVARKNPAAAKPSHHSQQNHPSWLSLPHAAAEATIPGQLGTQWWDGMHQPVLQQTRQRRQRRQRQPDCSNHKLTSKTTHSEIVSQATSTVAQQSVLPEKSSPAYAGFAETELQVPLASLPTIDAIKLPNKHAMQTLKKYSKQYTDGLQISLSSIEWLIGFEDYLAKTIAHLILIIEEKQLS